MRLMKQLRIYIDTSVFGGCFDEEFEHESRALFREIKSGKFKLIISPVVIRELEKAPSKIQSILADIPNEHIEILSFSNDSIQLRDAYLEAGILGIESKFDAEHIAYASVAEVDMVISWNFKHIVHFDKIKQYQAINLLNGYKPIEIYNPKEIIDL
jgi:predicted nucleic acid-binding protein